MATSLAATVKASLSWAFSNVLAGSISPTVQSSFEYKETIENGTGAAGTADLIYAVQTTIAGGGSTTFDLAGSLADWFGNTITMARVKFMLFILLTTTTASSVSIGNATAPLINWISAGTATVKVLNGGVFLLGAPGGTGYAVTATTADGVKVLNNDGTNTATLQAGFIGSTA